MRLGHVVELGAEPAPGAVPSMAGHPSAAVEDLHRVLGQPDLDFPVDQAVGNTVVVVVELDVVTQGDAAPLEGGELVPPRRQRAQRGPVQRLVQ